MISPETVKLAGLDLEYEILSLPPFPLLAPTTSHPVTTSSSIS